VAERCRNAGDEIARKPDPRLIGARAVRIVKGVASYFEDGCPQVEIETLSSWLPPLLPRRSIVPRRAVFRRFARPSWLTGSLSARRTWLRIHLSTAPVADPSVRHTHDSSWPASVDWPDLRNHLVNTHGERPDDIDDLEPFVDRTTGRRRHAEDRHDALHRAELPSPSR
jgi:hypothetical protein